MEGGHQAFYTLSQMSLAVALTKSTNGPYSSNQIYIITVLQTIFLLCLFGLGQGDLRLQTFTY